MRQHISVIVYYLAEFNTGKSTEGKIKGVGYTVYVQDTITALMTKRVSRNS